MKVQGITKRVVDNLISNAINYGVNDLRIAISRDNNVSVTFQNTVQDGHAIDINRLFDKFYTVDLSRSYSGTGLGLYIVKLLTEKMGVNIKGLFEDNKLSICLSFEKLME